MHLRDTFCQNPIVDGSFWTGKCGLLAAGVVAGWVTGHLQLSCIAAISGFVVWQGFLPFASFAVALMRDMRKCREEKLFLQDMVVELADELPSVDASDAGSIFKLIAAIEANRDRMNKQDAASRFLAVSRQEWEFEIAPILTAAEQAPVLGLGGSLLGMLIAIGGLSTAFEPGADGAANAFGPMFGAMSTMVSTTLVGCFGALMLIGLASIASIVVNRHHAELEMIASLLLEQNPTDDRGMDPDIDTLFGGQ